ncbi:MAG: HAD-IIB family hydrolase [Ruminococcaceae bacterium]|nr:HAD-IIB family hydrolase [Oscillospiraceae bacterium]
MAKYDGILIMSDWDGTLSTGGTVSEENAEAIRGFQCEGGKFTMCSGRNYNYFDAFADFVVPNAPICAYNGALIVNTDGRILRRSFLGGEIFPSLFELAASGHFQKMNVYTPDTNGPAQKDIKEVLDNTEKYRSMKLYKTVFVAETEEQALLGGALAEKILPDGYTAVRSWSTGLEILKHSASKGEALKFLKSYLGARLAVAVGDFENDVDMLRAADIGYAVANAASSAKAAADRITVAAEESAIAKIIRELS